MPVNKKKVINNLALIVPNYNDWESVVTLSQDIARALKDGPQQAVDIYVVDDGSTDPEPDWTDFRVDIDIPFSVSVIRLSRNLGHQRAILAGLSELNKTNKYSHIGIMDGDGEDRPGDIRELLETSNRNPGSAVFARRMHRSEGIIFKFSYMLFKLLFRILTGSSLRIGNFCILPASIIGNVLEMPEARMHFAAALKSSSLPTTEVPVDRGERYSGQSKMNFSTLVLHGLSAIAVYADIVFTRVLILTVALMLATIISVIVVVCVRLFTDTAIPGWATYVSGMLFIVFIQSIVLCLSNIFLSLNRKTQPNIYAADDAAEFVQDTRLVSGKS